jgi:hypothetical protein
MTRFGTRYFVTAIVSPSESGLCACYSTPIRSRWELSDVTALPQNSTDGTTTRVQVGPIYFVMEYWAADNILGFVAGPGEPRVVSAGIRNALMPLVHVFEDPR